MTSSRISPRQRRLTAAVASLIGLALVPAEAVTYTWKAPNSGFWSAATNWQAGIAPSGNNSTDVLIFGGDVGATAGVSPNYTATVDPSGFILNTITLQATDSTLAGRAHVISGGTIIFAGASPQLTQNGGGGITFNAPIQLGTNLTLGGSGLGTVTLNAAVSGAFDIVKTGTSTFRFGSVGSTSPSDNTWFGTLLLQGGTIRFNNNAYAAPTALRSNAVDLGSTALLEAQFKASTVDPKSSLRLGTLTGSGRVEARRETATAGVFDSADIVITALSDGIFSGTVRNAPVSGGVKSGDFTVRGIGTQTFSGTLDISKDVYVGRGATMVLTGNATLAAQTSGNITLNGGTFRLDNTALNNNNRLRDGDTKSTGLDTIGGGTFSLIGSTSGTTEQIARLQLGSDTNPRSGALTINVTQPAGGGATVLNIQSYSRDLTNSATYATVDFTSNSTLGNSGSNPRIVFNNLNGVAFSVTLQNGLLSSTAGAADTGWATVNGQDFATHTSANGIAPVSTVAFGSSSSSSDNVLVTGDAAISSSTNFSRSSLKLAPSAANQKLSIASTGNLVTTGLLLAGTNDYSIGNDSGGTGGWNSNSARYAYVQSAILALDAPISGNGAVVKSGLGTLALTASSNSLSGASTVINAGTVRASAATLPGGDLKFRGGVLEITGGGVFNRQLGVTAGKVNWSGYNTTALTPAEIQEDRGSGGFAAVGADVQINMGFHGNFVASWEDDMFVKSGHALIFGSTRADHAVDWTDNLSLTTSVPPNSANLDQSSPNYNAREIRVVDNSLVSTDRAKISGTISGNVRNDLLKTGDGVLELSATNTFQGATLVTQGTLLVNGSTQNSFLTDVKSGAKLGGTGTVGAVRVEAGAVLAPGELAGSLAQTSTLNVVGTFNLATSTSQLALELSATGSDRVNVQGNVLLQGAQLVGTLLNSFLAAPGSMFFIVTNDGLDPVQGTFAQGSQVTFGGQTFDISYTGDFDGQSFTGGNDIVLRAIPEPTTAGLLLGSGVALIGGMRRRRR